MGTLAKVALFRRERLLCFGFDRCCDGGCGRGRATTYETMVKDCGGGDGIATYGTSYRDDGVAARRGSFLPSILPSCRRAIRFLS